MAYVKNGFVANETVVTANALNHMEDGIENATQPHNYALDGADLSTVFASAAAFHNALAGEDYSKIHIGDYWPLSLSGTFRDYGSYTVPSGTPYFTNAALTAPGGTTSAKFEGQYESATAVNFTVSGATVYCAVGNCLNYYERTLSNAVVNLEVAGINDYWRYGDSGALTGNKPHITFISRDCLPFTMRMRKANSVWEDTSATNPWLGSALYKTLNDPNYGVVKLIAATDVGAYMYAGLNGGGMRAMMETKAAGATTATSWGWADRGKLFLPFESEIWGHGVWGGNSGYTLGVNLQLPIFIGTRRHISKGIGNGASRRAWWTASSFSSNAANFCNVSSSGFPDSNGAVSAAGVPVCFVMI